MAQNIEAPFIHFHIPKTAGTSLRAVMIREFGPEYVGFMMPNRQFVRADELPFNTEDLDDKRRVARVAGQLNAFSEKVKAVNEQATYNFFELNELEARGITVATGHLVLADITDIVSHLPRTTVVQEPFSRTLSHYRHWREARGTMWWHDGTVPYTDNVSFEEFANDPKNVNYQARQIGGLTMHTVGVANKLTEFLEEIGLNPGNSVPRLNTSIDHVLPSFGSGFVRRFIEANMEDYELYTAADERFVS